MITLILLMYGWRVRRKGWWYRFPFLPIPPKRWLLWRFETAWGIDSTYPKWEDFPPIKVMISDIYKFGHFLKNVGR
jgi:hypothetical protein